MTGEEGGGSGAGSLDRLWVAQSDAGKGSSSIISSRLTAMVKRQGQCLFDSCNKVRRYTTYQGKDRFFRNGLSLTMAFFVVFTFRLQEQAQAADDYLVRCIANNWLRVLGTTELAQID
jgi:hypothetical protein